jgi:hypothetical protein
MGDQAYYYATVASPEVGLSPFGVAFQCSAPRSLKQPYVALTVESACTNKLKHVPQRAPATAGGDRRNRLSYQEIVAALFGSCNFHFGYYGGDEFDGVG